LEKFAQDGAVVVYDVRTGRLLGSRHCHRDSVCSVDVHPRSGWMASGGFDGRVNFFRPPVVSTPKVSGRPPGGLLERRPLAPKLPVREVEMSQPF
jgi:WD40 repeat protein